LISKLHKSAAQATHLIDELRKAFPEALATNCSPIESGLTNHPKDRHVLAAAIRSSAQTIVTFNLKHFPIAALEQYDLEALHPDEFLVNQFYLDEALVIQKFTEQARAIGRSVEEQIQAFQRGRALPLFTRTMADCLAIEL
jgi:hypothetical protein